MFRIVTVDARGLDVYEQLGTKSKFWYDHFRYLFKAGRAGTGENWAEVVCAGVAELIGLPHAHYELAETQGIADGSVVRGVSTPNFTPRGARLVLGNELIFGVSAGETSKAQTRRREHHTVSRLAAFMGIKSILPPLGWEAPDGGMSARGVMAGYLMLDALVGNQDRHEENWGLVRTAEAVHLAPTFDHASSLGRNESDERRAMKLAAVRPDHGVPGYAAKAASQLYDKEHRRISTLEAFLQFSAYCREDALYWLGRLRRMDEAAFRLLLDQVPSDWITECARDFAVQLLLENKRRLLSEKL
ncbi:hypothetical protein [Stenotrophomonas sp.]|uniref:hypothetical protein n=1 Tax=Stenotrophomonas sp. TaxID=69392 RepID=UPI00289CA78F|nr:hypothetical protein [Stenotrophomonas sp.]